MFQVRIPNAYIVCILICKLTKASLYIIVTIDIFVNWQLLQM